MKKLIKKFLKLFKPAGLVAIMDNSFVSSDSHVGDYTYIGFNCFITKAEIGRYCSIANNVSIGNGEHDLNDISTCSYFYDNAYEKLTEKSCRIGHDVWIGVDCIVRRGVTIGDGAVIGANSFVNKDVPAYAIAVGTPAKILKYRFDEAKIKTLLNSKWWELDLESAKKKIKELRAK